MLEFENVSKVFHPNTQNERVALDNVSLSLKDGDFVTIVGGNGAGKTTIMNAISGIFLADSGRILLDGEDITFLPEYKRARHIGRLFQDPMKGTAPNMTIAENLYLAYRQATGPKIGRFSIGISKPIMNFFREQLAQLDLGLENRLKTKIGLLSGGQRQAVTLLMATICTPKLLMLDEHTAALDPATGEKVLRLTKEIIARDKITTLMITHDIPSSLAMGNRTIMLDGGKIAMDISGEERENMTVEKLYGMF
ncbi:MAG: ATP-binding cassette domain-containing protein [Defluviitaleaceae bacterium]|nr:ATP-binding cassette domain-containing protein [Defluviitaleaceae bacterium]MCL2262642.1 ATP-binding cassette domain-containing protein [Defluviitaleaceae bacterium]